MSLLLALTGSSSVNYSLVCSAGSFALSGKPATLSYVSSSVARSLVCSAGSYALTGKNAALNYVAGAAVRSLICSPGTYALTGSSARLVRVGKDVELLGGGGDWKNIGHRKRTKEDVQQERIKLGVLPPVVRKIAKKALTKIEAPTREVINEFAEEIRRIELKSSQRSLAPVQIKAPQFDLYLNVMQSILIAREERSNAIQKQRKAEIELQIRLEIEQELDDELCLMLLM